jgi:hypothetical protein
MKKKIIKKINNWEHIIKMFLMTVIIITIGSLIFNNELNKIFSKVHQIFEPPKEVDIALEKKIKNLTKGYPIEEMASEIAKQDDEVAAFLVAIAKKESNWGKRTPKYKGKECYNYWGFRRKRLLMGSGGHTCFDNPKDAVDTVADRIEDLIAKGIDTPREMVIWKCGRCTGPAANGAGKWIADIRYYYNKMMDVK